MSKHKQISIHNVVKTFSNAEINKNIEVARLRHELGLELQYYDSNDKLKIEYVPSMYKSNSEYYMDKAKANKLIDEDKTIPNELAEKLISARIELQNKGFYI